MTVTLVAFVFTLVASSLGSALLVKRAARQRAWLDELESRRSSHMSEENR